MIVGQTGTLDISNFFGNNEPQHVEIEEPREIPNNSGKHAVWRKRWQSFTLEPNMQCQGTYNTCSLCGYFNTGHRDAAPYCGGCGARMDGESE